MRCELGIISDTHGLLRPEAVEALRGCARIIHAGDVDRGEILGALHAIAPTVAVRGNVDRGAWADALPEDLRLVCNGVVVYVIHNIHDLPTNFSGVGIDLIVSGHSHQPSVREEAGVCYLNPGSAGKRRFSLPVTLARVEITSGAIRPRLIDLFASPLSVKETVPGA